MARSNCSYRIIEKVHIGKRVRKTSDSSTVPFINKPMKDVKIESYTKDGFCISHPSMPRTAFLDFDQLPLKEVTIEKGIIKTELTFVEVLMRNHLGLQLIRTDTFDYLELLDDKKEKDEAEKFKLPHFKIGDKMLSCICKEGNNMYYLGTFSTVFTKQRYAYRYESGSHEGWFHILNKITSLAFFAFKDSSSNKFTIKSYSLTHKNVVELYDIPNDEDCKIFENEARNLEMIKSIQNYNYRSQKLHPIEPIVAKNYYSGLESEIIYVGFLNKDKNAVLKEAVIEAKKINIDLLKS
jgi:hypothetical protein